MKFALFKIIGVIMISKKEVLKNILDEDEKIIISKVYDKYLKTLKDFETTYTDFLNPSVLSKVTKIFKFDTDVQMEIDAGTKSNLSERYIVVFINKNLGSDEFLTPLTLCKISYNSKFGKELQHKDFLGALIGLGIKREKMGDISIFEDYALVTLYKDMISYILNNLDYVGRTKVKTEELDISEQNLPKVDKEKKSKLITVASLRLDTIVSGAFNLSRNNASKLIKSEKVFINWEMCNNISKELKNDDIVTARGYGRIKIENLKGKSKKGKEIINLILY